MIKTSRIWMEDAGPEHIDSIIEMENHPDNRNFVWQGTREEHIKEIKDPNHMLLVIKEKPGEEIIGYALIHMDYKSNIFELRRIVIKKKGQGYGREAMEAIIKYAFEETHTNRFWLDVYPDNTIGINLYESLGMHRDGVLRDNYLSERGYLDQIIYSLLRREYHRRNEND